MVLLERAVLRRWPDLDPAAAHARAEDTLRVQVGGDGRGPRQKRSEARSLANSGVHVRSALTPQPQLGAASHHLIVFSLSALRNFSDLAPSPGRSVHDGELLCAGRGHSCVGARGRLGAGPCRPKRYNGEVDRARAMHPSPAILVTVSCT